jgi:isocitrate dehydrogenase
MAKTLTIQEKINAIIVAKSAIISTITKQPLTRNKVFGILMHYNKDGVLLSDIIADYMSMVNIGMDLHYGSRYQEDESIVSDLLEGL